MGAPYYAVIVTTATRALLKFYWLQPNVAYLKQNVGFCIK